MNRKTFLKQSLGCCALATLGSPAAAAPPADEQSEQFIQNWLADLLATMDQELDRETAVRMIEGCGRGCVRRHQFKQDLIAKGSGSVDTLIDAVKQYMEVWREGDDRVHIRFGEASPGCYCPAAKYRPPVPNDLHCECSRTSHQTIWETALGRPVKVEVLESVRRGGQTCHFLVHL